MELYKPFWNIYRLIERVKNNKVQFPHFYQRLKALEKLAIFLEQEDVSQISLDVQEALEKLGEVLVTADNFSQRFSDAHMLNQMMKSTNYRAELDSVNKSLNDAFVTLSSALHIYQGQKLDMQDERLTEQERKLAELEDRLMEQADVMQRAEVTLAYMCETRAIYCVLL